MEARQDLATAKVEMKASCRTVETRDKGMEPEGMMAARSRAVVVKAAVPLTPESPRSTKSA
jgi:hypothetical protein